MSIKAQSCFCRFFLPALEQRKTKLPRERQKRKRKERKRRGEEEKLMD